MQAGRSGADFGVSLNSFLLRFGTSFKLYTEGIAVGRGGIVKKVRPGLLSIPVLLWLNHTQLLPVVLWPRCSPVSTVATVSQTEASRLVLVNGSASNAVDAGGPHLPNMADTYCWRSCAWTLQDAVSAMAELRRAPFAKTAAESETSGTSFCA